MGYCLGKEQGRRVLYVADVFDVLLLVSMTAYLAMVIAACILNFRRALALFVLTILGIFFIVWDFMMGRYEDRIAGSLSPCGRFLEAQWFWLKW